MSAALPNPIGRRVKILQKKFAQSVSLPFAEVLPEGQIRQAVEAEGMRWRKRIFEPMVTIWAFLSQVLDGDQTCRAAVARVVAYLAASGERCSPDTSAYCQARDRLPEGLLARLVRTAAEGSEGQVHEEHRWWGRRVWLVDGSSASMPDTPENQAEYPQPSVQRPGCGFPVVRIVALFSLATGMIRDVAMGSLHVAEKTLFRTLWPILRAGDIVVGDRHFCGYADIALLRRQGTDVVFRKHQSRNDDFRRGRRLGRNARLVTWTKGVRRAWLSREEFAALPKQMTLREVRFCTLVRGFRSRQITVVTTLLDPVLYPKEELAELYRERWSAELDLRAVKSTMHMDVLRCLKPQRVRKEIWTHLLAYNLIRALMWKAATQNGRRPLRISLKGALQHYLAFAAALAYSPAAQARRIYERLLEVVATETLPDRPNRCEPRARKRRPKPYKLLTEPRHVLRRRLAG